jgi:hypothetical protein
MCIAVQPVFVARRIIQRAIRLATNPVMGTARINPTLPTNVRTISSAMGSRLMRRQIGSA